MTKNTSYFLIKFQPRQVLCTLTPIFHHCQQMVLRGDSSPSPAPRSLFHRHDHWKQPITWGQRVLRLENFHGRHFTSFPPFGGCHFTAPPSHFLQRFSEFRGGKCSGDERGIVTQASGMSLTSQPPLTPNGSHSTALSTSFSSPHSIPMRPPHHFLVCLTCAHSGCRWSSNS